MNAEMNEFKAFMLKWNNEHPYDYWWRTKHKVAFLSKEHKECSFVSQVLEYQEDLIYQEIKDKNKKTDGSNKDEYIPNIGEWLKRKEDSLEITQEDIEDFEAQMMELIEQDKKKLNKDE